MVAAVALTACVPFLVLVLLCVSMHRNQESALRESHSLRRLEIATAWFLGLMFLCGGMSKLMPFPGFMGPVWLEQELAQHGLGLFARFIAWSEAVIGLCLLVKPARVLGAVMLVPLLLNILMVTVSMEWRGTPWIILFFLMANMFLLAFHFRRWQPIFDIATNWLVIRLNRNVQFTKAATWGGCVLILMGPVLHLVHDSLSTIAIVLGFFGLIWGEFNFRFRYQPED